MMDKQNRKISPMEFLAQLKAGGKGAKSLTRKGPASPGEGHADPSNPHAPGAGARTAPADPAALGAAAGVANGLLSGGIETSVAGDGNLGPGPKPLKELFDRVNDLLGTAGKQEDDFKPVEPQTIADTGLTPDGVEQLVLKYLLARGSTTGRKIAQQICLPFGIIDPLLKSLKQEQLVVFKGAGSMGDYEYALTELGRERARRYTEECTYYGAAPVTLRDYLHAMGSQSIARQHATPDDLKEAFADLVISEKMLGKLGPAINSGRGMFLFGEPGNGKTSIAERVTSCFGSTIWIPRALGIDGDIIRIYDPAVHELVEQPTSEGIFNQADIDQRWIHIRRPTVIVGGELTMEELEVRQNTVTKICEAPLQLKSNCGTLVIDDFGRQRMPVDELLNRWIVPLEKRYDYLNLPSGKKIQVPFDQIIIFSTNLEPRDLVDGAFLRRIPCKIQVCAPTEEQFHRLCEIMAPNLCFQYDAAVVDYLLERHFKPTNRSMRACHPRDLLLQVRNYCVYNNLPKVITPEAFDFACENYFSIM